MNYKLQIKQIYQSLMFQNRQTTKQQTNQPSLIEGKLNLSFCLAIASALWIAAREISCIGGSESEQLPKILTKYFQLYLAKIK